MKKNKIAYIASAIIFLLILGAFLVKGFSGAADNSQFWNKIKGIQGYTRVVSAEELEFYSYFVERDLPRDTDETEINALTREYAEEVNAVFYLGNQLGICEPYSYELLKFRLDQENETRKVKIQQGEVVYGLSEFTLETYFQHVLGDLKADIYYQMELMMDDEVMKDAEDFYEENKESFRGREKVVYEATLGGETVVETADAEQLNMLGKMDMGLADFLNAAETGDKYEDVFNGEDRSIVLKDVVYTKDDFESNKERILYIYIREELFDRVITMIMENNSVEYDLS